MKECRICKTQASDDTVFCSVCGTRLPEKKAANTLPIFPEGDVPNENIQIFINKIDTLIDLLKKATIPKRYEYFMLNPSEYHNILYKEHPDVFKKNYYSSSWEEKDVYIKYTEDYIQNLGKAGWELVDHDDYKNGGFGYMFKREIIE